MFWNHFGRNMNHTNPSAVEIFSYIVMFSKFNADSYLGIIIAPQWNTVGKEDERWLAIATFLCDASEQNLDVSQWCGGLVINAQSKKRVSICSFKFPAPS